MTKREIHIRSVLRKKGYLYDPKQNCFDKYHWKNVEPNKRKTYVHVVFYIHEDKASLTMFTDFAIKSPAELEKYYIVYNRVKGDLEELGVRL